MEINYQLSETFNGDEQIKFKTTIFIPCLFNYNYVYLFVKRTLTVVGDNSNNKIIFKNFAPLTSSVSEINNACMDNAQDINVIMSIYKSLEYSKIYSATRGNVWECYRDVLHDNSNTVHFKILFIYFILFIYLFIYLLKMSLISCEINLKLTLSANCIISNYAGATRFSITDIKFYLPVAAASTQRNAKVLQQLKTEFKPFIN